MERFEKVAILKNEVQARLVDSVLSERGIPHILRSYYDSAYDGLFQGQKGWGHIESPLDFKEEILAIIEDIERQSRISLVEQGSNEEEDS